MNVVRSFVNYAIFRELCDRMRFEVDCAKSHHRVISEGLMILTNLSKKPPHHRDQAKLNFHLMFNVPK